MLYLAALFVLLIPFETKANTIFLGAIIAKEKSVAVVGTSDGTKHVRIGQEVDGYTLTKLEFREAFFRKNQNYYRLMAGQYLNSSTTTNQPIITTGIEIADNKISVSRTLRNYFRDKEGLLTIMMQAAAVPVVIDDEVTGFKILEIDKGSVYDRIGLRDKDVIHSIDGVEITGALVAIKLLNRIKNLDNFTFTRSRYGVVKTMDVAVND